MGRPEVFHVFISAVSSEFGEARSLVTSDLRARGIEVKVQEDFRQEADSDTTLAKLHELIKDCYAVVCVVGRRSGSVPPPAAAQPYADILPDDLEQASYTHWELLFARHYKRRLFLYHGAAEYQPDQPEPTGEDHPVLQASFVSWLFDDLGLDRGNFSNPDELGRLVLRVDWPQVSLDGVKHRATTSDDGLSLEEAAPPTIPRLNPEKASRMPPNRWPFVGRKTEKAKLMQALKTDQFVALVGPGGIGKKALLKDLTHHEDFGSRFKDGTAIHPDWEYQEDPEDLFQAIWEEFYEADASTVQPRKRRRQLADKEALIFLPDVEASSQLIERVLDQMPLAVFCVSGDPLAVPGLRIPLDGLTDQEEMLAVFEGRYRDSIPAAARTNVASMCVLLDGDPSYIGFLADRAREEAPDVPEEPGEHPLVAWAAQRRQLTVEELRSWLAPAEGQSAIAVAQATGVQTPRKVMVDVAGSAESVDDALAGNFLEAASPRYRLNAALIGTPDDDSALMRKIFQSAVAWADEADVTEIYANREFVLRMMKWGGEHGSWSEVIKLGMATGGPMALGGRHGAWEQVLAGVVTGARAMEPPDIPAEAWALHQLGSRALLRDELKEARILLHESLRRRPEGDDQAVAVTRRNLSLVPGAILPLVVLLLWFVFFGAWAGVLATGSPPFKLDVRFPGEVVAPADVLTIATTDAFRVAAADSTFAVSIEDQTINGAVGDPAFCVVVGTSCLPDVGPGIAIPPGSGVAVDVDGESYAPCEVVGVDENLARVRVDKERACYLQIGFGPQTNGLHEAKLVMEAEADGKRFEGTLTARAISIPSSTTTTTTKTTTKTTTTTTNTTKTTIPPPVHLIADIDPDFFIYDTANQEVTFSLTNVGTGPFTVGNIPDAPEGFDVGDDKCSGSPLSPGGSCMFTVEYLGGRHAGFLDIPFESEVEGDVAVLLVGGS